MGRLTIFIGVFLISLFPILGQDYQEIDSYVLTLRGFPQQSYQELGQAVRRRARTDELTARGIYTWLIHNVEWQTSQVEEFMDSGGDRSVFTPNDADYVYQHGKGVCTGFSRLFAAIAQAAGLEAAVVPGYVKGAEDFYQGLLGDGPTHVWNTVKVDGQWRLVDGAMGQTQTDSDYYFFTDPDVLILSHFPEEQRWQLLDQPISRQQFEEGVSVYSGYVNYEIQRVFPDSKYLRARPNETLSVQITSSEDVWIEGAVSAGADVLREIPVYSSQEGRITTSSVTFSNPGQYNLMLFCRSRSVTTEFELAMIYIVMVE